MQTNLIYEKELLDKAKSNNQGFEELYKYFIDDVYRFSYSLVNNKEAAEDITSQTFIAFYQKIQGFEWQNVSIKFWLFRTARNLALRKFEEKPTEIFDEKEAYNYGYYEISFVDELINKDLIEHVKLEIAQLKPEEQEVINLRIWEGMQFQEIASLQNIKLNTCKWRFYRAIDKISKSLENKKIRSFIPLPVLFTAIKAVSMEAEYIPSAGLKESLLQDIQSAKSSISSVSSLSTKKIAVIATAGIITVASALGAYAIVSGKIFPQDNTNQPTVVQQPTQTPTASITVDTITPTISTTTIPQTITPSQTPTTPQPTPYRFNQEFTNSLVDGNANKSRFTLNIKPLSSFTTTSSLCSQNPNDSANKDCYIVRVQKDSKNYMELKLEYVVNGIGGFVEAKKNTPLLRLPTQRLARIQNKNTFVYYQYDTQKCTTKCTNTVMTADENIGVTAGFEKDGFVSSLKVVLENQNNTSLLTQFEEIIRTITLE